MANKKYLLTILLLISFEKAFSTGQGWFAYTLLSNPGLNSSTVTSADACISSCASSGSCSAISYQPSSMTCVYSYCANLYLVKNTGWNTYVLNSLPVENVDYPAPQFEWMLTDSCGLANTGNAPGIPTMNLASGVGYLPSPTAYQGNAVHLSSSQPTSDATIYTATSELLNCSYVKSSFTLGSWFNFELSLNNTVYFMSLNLSSGISLGAENVRYQGRLKFGISGLAFGSVITETTDVWTHYAVVYDALASKLIIYVNASVFRVDDVNLTPTANFPQCNMVAIGTRPGPWGRLVGRVFCSRVFFSAMDASQLKRMADSCFLGRVRDGV